MARGGSERISSRADASVSGANAQKTLESIRNKSSSSSEVNNKDLLLLLLLPRLHRNQHPAGAQDLGISLIFIAGLFQYII